MRATGTDEIQVTRPRILVAGLAIYAALSLISMAAMSIGAGILGLALIFSFGAPGKFFSALRAGVRANRNVRIFAWLSAAFAVIGLLSLVQAKLWPLGYGGKYPTVRVLGEASKLWYFGWPFVLWTGLRACRSEERLRVLRVWLGVFLVLSVIGIIQYFTGWPRPQVIPTDLKHYHATLFLGHHLSVASILIFPFFALLDFSGLPRPLRWTGVVLGFATLMLTFSRTLWIALPFGILVWAFLRLKARGRIALSVLILVGGAAAYQLPQVRVRLANPMGIHEREDLWEANWEFFRARPVLGVGLRQNQDLAGIYLEQKHPGQYVFQGHAHDNVLDILSTTGAMGELSFVAWWIFLFWILALEIGRQKIHPESMKTPFFGRGLLAALVVYQINGLTQVNFWEGKVQHQLMWMIAWILLWSEGTSSEDRH